MPDHDPKAKNAMRYPKVIDEAEIEVLSGRLAPTQGTCMVMGTASTMGCLAEALGIALPGSGTIPATHADRIRAAEASGREAVRLARGGPKPRAKWAWQSTIGPTLGSLTRTPSAVAGSRSSTTSWR